MTYKRPVREPQPRPPREGYLTPRLREQAEQAKAIGFLTHSERDDG